MGSSKKFWMGMLVGAIAGGSATLFEKSTRQAVKEDFKKASGSIKYVMKNPTEWIDEVMEAANKVRATVEQVTEDVVFITEKMEEMKNVPPQVSELVKGTKDALSKVASSEHKGLNNKES